LQHGRSAWLDAAITTVCCSFYYRHCSTGAATAERRRKLLLPLRAEPRRRGGRRHAPQRLGATRHRVPGPPCALRRVPLPCAAKRGDVFVLAPPPPPPPAEPNGADARGGHGRARQPRAQNRGVRADPPVMPSSAARLTRACSLPGTCAPPASGQPSRFLACACTRPLPKRLPSRAQRARHAAARARAPGFGRRLPCAGAFWPPRQGRGPQRESSQSAAPLLGAGLGPLLGD